MKKLEKKVAIVTGGSSGIGKAIAELFAREGAIVIVSDINEAAGNKVIEGIVNRGGEAIFIRADSSKPEDNEALVKQTINRYGSPDITVNNAGIGGPFAPTGKYPIDGWQKVIDINLTGVFYGMRYQIPAMLEKGGSIINIASILGTTGTKYYPAYVAAKHGVVGLTKAAALEYADKKIRINSVCPGYINTPLINAAEAATMKALVGLHPVGRLGEAEEVAEVALFLASPGSSFVTGSDLTVDGGYMAQ